MFSTLFSDIITGNIEFICSGTLGMVHIKLEINCKTLQACLVLKYIYILCNLLKQSSLCFNFEINNKSTMKGYTFFHFRKKKTTRRIF